MPLGDIRKYDYLLALARAHAISVILLLLLLLLWAFFKLFGVFCVFLFPLMCNLSFCSKIAF